MMEPDLVRTASSHLREAVDDLGSTVLSLPPAFLSSSFLYDWRAAHCSSDGCLLGGCSWMTGLRHRLMQGAAGDPRQEKKTEETRCACYVLQTHQRRAAALGSIATIGGLSAGPPSSLRTWRATRVQQRRQSRWRWVDARCDVVCRDLR